MPLYLMLYCRYQARETNPDLADDAQKLSSVPNYRFDRWRGDPPYNINTAKKIYGTSLPSSIELLQAGARGVQSRILDVFTSRASELSMASKRSQESWMYSTYSSPK